VTENKLEFPYKTIVVALDGSDDSLAGGDLAITLAAGSGAVLRAVHVYDTIIHSTRFREMEPGLPAQYHTGESLGKLRQEHDSLMTDGFRALSLGYMEDFLAAAARAGVAVTEKAVEGRNYLGLLELISRQMVDLVVLGATGLGAQQDGMLGSTALRVLRRAPCDVIIARKKTRESGITPVLACTDGSGHATSALHKAASLAAFLAMELQLFSAYDVEFHKTIFKTMARSLSADRQREIGLDRQEMIHEELIDKSLEALYSTFLQDGARSLSKPEMEVKTCLRPGKAYRAIVEHAVDTGAGLVVVGRFGHNCEPVSDIGSHAEAVVRLAPCHVLVCNGGTNIPAVGSGVQIAWDEEALRRLERIPPSVRPMARKAIEQQVLAKGERRVTLAAMEAAAGHFGMGKAE
jgi:nucleotide-binding universal stress UspA family protein